MLSIQALIDDTKCFEVVRQLHWPEGVRCPACGSAAIAKRGFHTTQPARQGYECQTCQRQFDDLRGTIFEGHPQPRRVWIVCLYLMGVNLSNQQIAAELELNKDAGQGRTTRLREGGVVKKSLSP